MLRRMPSTLPLGTGMRTWAGEHPPSPSSDLAVRGQPPAVTEPLGNGGCTGAKLWLCSPPQHPETGSAACLGRPVGP